MNYVSKGSKEQARRDRIGRRKAIEAFCERHQRPLPATPQEAAELYHGPVFAELVNNLRAAARKEASR